MRCMNDEEQPTSDPATHAGLVVKRAEETDWERVKAVRLAALAESPSAFGSTLAEEREYVEADWRERCRDPATFLAFRDGAPIGIAAGVNGTNPDERKLIAMWGSIPRIGEQVPRPRSSLRSGTGPCATARPR